MESVKRILGLNKREWLAFAAVLLVVALVFVTGVFDKQKVWTDMGYHDISFTEDRYAFDAQAGDSYGVVSKGPGYDLPEGTYRVKIRAYADGSNLVRFTAKNSAEIVPEYAVLDPALLDNEIEFRVCGAADNFEMLFDFCDGTRMEIVDIRMYSPMYKDHAFTFAFFAAAACLLYWLWARGKLTAERRGVLILMAVAVIYASAPSLKDNLTMVIDSRYHLARLHNLADGLRHGQLPVRCGGFSYDGYGAVTSAFYPDLFLYPSALMMLAGASTQYAVHAFQIALNIIAAAAMYAAGRRMLGCRQAAAASAVLYVLSIYRITDIYTRGAFGEAAAMSFLPLFILGMWEMIFGDKERWPLLALSAAAIFLSHILSTIMCACLAAGMCALFIRRMIREKRILPVVKAACFAGLLCLYQLVPFLTYSLQGIGAESIRGNMELAAIAPAQLFLLGGGDMPVNPKDRTLSGIALEIGMPLVLGAALALYRALTAEKKEEGMREALLLTGAGALFAFMCTTMFPWGYVSALTMKMSDYIQFPWRFMMFTAAMFALAGGYGYTRLIEDKRNAGVVLALVAALFAAMPAISDQTRDNNFLQYGRGISPGLSYTEYTLPGTRVRETGDTSVLTEGSVTVTAYEKDGTNVTAQVIAQTDAKVSLPLFGFDGYKASLDGKALDWSLGDNNRLTVALPAGAQGELRVWFAGKAVWRAADIISLAAAAALCALCMRRKRAAKGA